MNIILWTNGTKINLHQNDKQKIIWQRKELFMIRTTYYLILWCGRAWLPMELVGNLLFINDVTADKSRRRTAEVYKGNITCSDSAKCFNTHWTLFRVQIDNDLKHTSKATQDFLRQRCGMFCSGQASHLT